MVQRTVLKVDLSCQRCKKKVLKSVSAIEGVDKIETDEAKGTLTVTGNADPYDIIVSTRKAGKQAEVVTVGPPPPPPKQDVQKKPEEKAEKHKSEAKKPEQKAASIHDPLSCSQCQRIVVVPMGYQEPNPSCSIM
ncbi:heavy metal-associated isoprenylated plant protein 43-like [Ricinus communis]|uniref:heavy metal-associated isoprenylated plant protein 43-like n=1 Tax=Ricinus communis TaxID=3988 RepID=UPI000772873B|nr:heavy metal-associated isoprenylated plant protein 43-like [Ricinus communis]|eukprot:XP_015576255.1 heavy metal-associated isoprenylated plant protein 43-like [Ricinus communis]